jgi:glycosyltransferase involved in cell wall biosynthesis
MTPANCSVVLLNKNAQILQAIFDYQSFKSIDVEMPLASCLMVTRDRFNLAINAIECFQHQTYRNKELVIVDEGAGDELQKFIQHLSHPEIKYFRMPTGQITLGELINFSVAQASGEYVCQWDDDDLSDPLRLDLQISVIQALRADCCLLDSLFIWWPHQQRLALSIRRLWENSMVCRKDIFPTYPSLPKGEDTDVVKQIIQNNHLAVLHQPNLYIYNIHQNNTWHHEHFEAHWQHAQQHFSQDAYVTILQQLLSRVPVQDYLQALNVKNHPSI